MSIEQNVPAEDDVGIEDDVDIEDADTSDVGEISHPFDPNKIRVRSWTPTVYNLMQRLEHGELDLAPEFQRKAGIWDVRRQSRLIESLLIRIPLPAFYLDELQPEVGKLSERYAVVDGVQRLTVLDNFVNKGAFRLSGLEFLKLEGRTYADLEPPLKRRIQETQLAVYVVEPGTPDEAKLNIFKRINTGGMALTAQEIRHAMSPGPVRKWLGEVAGMTEFREAMGASTATRMETRMDDRECVTRFAAFLDTGVEDYRKAGTDFDGFLYRAMDRLNHIGDDERAQLRDRFQRAMLAARKCLGKHAFRKIAPNGRRGPANKALFEATAVGLDACTDAELAELAKRPIDLLSAYRKALTDDDDLASAVSVSTGDKARVERRFNGISKIIQGVLR